MTHPPVLVMSEPAALEALPDLPGWALLSIRDDGMPPLRVVGDRPRLDLAFDDWPQAASRVWFPPQASHAARIVDFARALQGPPGVVVHCAAGISRSAAAVVGLYAAWGADPEAVPELLDAARRETRERGYRDATPCRPNPRLAALLDHALGLEWQLLDAVLDRCWAGQFRHDAQFYRVDVFE